MSKPKCPHCWAEMKENQLTCDICNGKSHTELTPLFIAALFIYISICIATILYTYMNGWFILN